MVKFIDMDDKDFERMKMAMLLIILLALSAGFLLGYMTCEHTLSAYYKEGLEVCQASVDKCIFFGQ